VALELPKLPKIDDLVAVALALDARVAALEEWREAHTQSMVNRQTQVNQIRQVADRDRWLQTLRPGRR
jgi:hypothetical protein